MDTEEPQYVKLVHEHDYARGLPLLMYAVRSGDGCAMGILATLCALGRGVPQDVNDAADWFRQAAVRGHVPSQAAFGACLANGHGVPQNHDEAAFWLYRAGTAGSRSAVEVLKDIRLRSPGAGSEYFTQSELEVLIREAHQLTPMLAPKMTLN